MIDFHVSKVLTSLGLTKYIPFEVMRSMPDMTIDSECRTWFKPKYAPQVIPSWSGVACEVRDKNNLTNEQFNEMVWYLGRCDGAGFAKTDDQIRLCAERWIAGKRKVTPPGTKKKKREAKKAKKMLSNVPKELDDAINEALAHPMTQQYLGGNEKVFNALFGMVMKKYKTEPTVIRELLTARLTELKGKK